MKKIIHYFYDDVDIWKKGNKNNPIFRMCYASWLRYCPDYEIKLWHDKMPEFQQMLKNSRFLRECYERKLWAFVADYVRYYALYNYGGIYLDTDVQLISNFDDYIDKPFFVSIEGDIVDRKNTPEPAVMGGMKGHPLLKAALDIYNSNEIFKINHCIANVVLGRCLKKLINFEHISYNDHLTKKANDFYLDFANKQMTDYELYRNQKIYHNDDYGVYIYPSEYFCPSWNIFKNDAITENTVSIHWNQSSWWGNSSQLLFLESLRFDTKWERFLYRIFSRAIKLVTACIPNKRLRRKLRSLLREKISK